MREEERKEQRIRRQRARRRKVMLIRMGIAAAAVAVICAGWKIFTSQSEKRKIREEQQELMEGYQSGAEEINRYCEAYVNQNGFAVPEGKESFADWLADQYGDPYRKDMTERLQAGLEEEDFYEATGESLIVLADRYLGRTDQAENQIYYREGAKEGRAVLSFAGDLCLAEEGFVLDHYNDSEGLSSRISPEILERTRAADIFFLNHEFCISSRGEPLQGKKYTFRAKPERTGILEELGTDLVSLANNHVYDYGPEAMEDTADILEAAEIPYVGGGRNYEEAVRPVYYVVNGIKIGYVAATRAEKIRYTPEAEENAPGVLLTYDTEAFNEVIGQAEKQCDYLVAYVHWGTEDSDQYETYQQEMAREFFASGADIIVGGHPHVLQGIEYMEEGPVVYSLGDFWFNDETKDTGVLEVEISIDGLEEMRFLPCRQQDFSTQYLKDPAEQQKLYSRLEGLSPNIEIDETGVIQKRGG